MVLSGLISNLSPELLKALDYYDPGGTKARGDAA
jgi:hypothetical protein